MKYSQKYVLVSFLHPMEVDTEFTMTDWPLHITFADVFAIELTVDIKRQLTDLIALQPSLRLTAGEDAILGTTKVALINNTSELQYLHNKIIDLLELNGAEFNTPEFTRTGFLPHSTVQKTARLHAGDEVEITSISLVDMFPGGDWQQRKVVNNFNLRKA